MHFFSDVVRLPPPEDRPKIKSIRYASPGAIELAAAVGVCLSVRTIVWAICGSVQKVWDTYSRIRDGMRHHKLADIDLQRREDEQKLDEKKKRFVTRALAEAKRMLRWPDDYYKVLAERAHNNELEQLKILLSAFRRFLDLAIWQGDGKIGLGEPSAKDLERLSGAIPDAADLPGTQEQPEGEDLLPPSKPRRKRRKAGEDDPSGKDA